jgi:nitrogen regulatory protein P-II 1
MKCLTLVIHDSAKQDLIDHLSASPDVSGFTLLPGEGHSVRTALSPFETVKDRVLGYVPRWRVDVILSEEALTRMQTYLRGSTCCAAGRGFWWVTEVLDSGRL